MASHYYYRQKSLVIVRPRHVAEQVPVGLGDNVSREGDGGSPHLRVAVRFPTKELNAGHVIRRGETVITCCSRYILAHSNAQGQVLLHRANQTCAIQTPHVENKFAGIRPNRRASLHNPQSSRLAARRRYSGTWSPSPRSSDLLVGRSYLKLVLASAAQPATDERRAEITWSHSHLAMRFIGLSPLTS